VRPLAHVVVAAKFGGDNGLEAFGFVCLLLVGFVQVGLWGLGGSIGFGGDVEFLVGVLRFRGVGLHRSRDSCIGGGAGLGLDSWIELRHICVELGECRLARSVRLLRTEAEVSGVVQWSYHSSAKGALTDNAISICLTIHINPTNPVPPPSVLYVRDYISLCVDRKVRLHPSKSSHVSAASTNCYLRQKTAMPSDISTALSALARYRTSVRIAEPSVVLTCSALVASDALDAPGDSAIHGLAFSPRAWGPWAVGYPWAL
jgi:hypothetical protein